MRNNYDKSNWHHLIIKLPNLISWHKNNFSRKINVTMSVFTCHIQYMYMYRPMHTIHAHTEKDFLDMYVSVYVYVYLNLFLCKDFIIVHFFTHY